VTGGSKRVVAPVDRRVEDDTVNVVVNKSEPE